MIERRPKKGDVFLYKPYGVYKDTYTVDHVGENLLHVTNSKNVKEVLIWNFGDELNKYLELKGGSSDTTKKSN